MFAALGVMLTYGAFSNAVVLDASSKQVVLQIIAQERWILTGCIVVAIVEVLTFHQPHHRTEPHKH